MQHSHSSRAFSLVELSIVLVILGLLVGGILAGQSLIRASELRAVGTEYHRFLTSFSAFRDKYRGLPGDITNATAFWGAAALPASCATTIGTGTQTCDGDGNANVTATGTSNEPLRAWQQLANAGLLEGSMNGVQALTNNYSASRANSPGSKISNGLWFLWSWPPGSVSANVFAGNYMSFLMLGKYSGADGAPELDLFTAQEVWNIDTKLDDGMPGTGKIVDRVWSVASGGCNNGTSVTDYAATYSLNLSGFDCRLLFRQVF